jgi:hypothetical protein
MQMSVKERYALDLSTARRIGDKEGRHPSSRASRTYRSRDGRMSFRPNNEVRRYSYEKKTDPLAAMFLSPSIPPITALRNPRIRI